MQVFKGSYTQFKAFKIKMQEQAQAALEAERAARTGGHTEAKQANAPRKTVSKYERKQIKSRMTEIEREVQALEAQQAVVSRTLENPPADQDKVLKLGAQYVEQQEKMESLLAEWGRLEERLGED